MVFLSSLIHALRESAGRSIANARPPRLIKPGSVPPWKQPLHVQSSIPSARETLSTFCRPSQPLSSKSSKESTDPIVKLFHSIVEHAILPVFRGLKTERKSYGLPEDIVIDIHQFLRKPTKVYSRPLPKPSTGYLTRRPLVVTAHPPASQVGLQLALKYDFGAHAFGFTGQTFNECIMSPSLGLRAAVDELEEQRKSWCRQAQKQRPRSNISTRTHSKESSMVQVKWSNLFQKAAQADSMIKSIVTELYLLVDEEDFECDSCSSSCILEFISDVEAERMEVFFDTESEDDPEDAFKLEETEQVRNVITTLYFPLSPDLFRLLAGSIVTDRQGENELNFKDQVEQVMDEFYDLRIHCVVPLERTLQEGPLSRFEHQRLPPESVCWTDDGVRQRRYDVMPIKYHNLNRDEVLSLLRTDLSPALYNILAHPKLVVQQDFDSPQEMPLTSGSVNSFHANAEAARVGGAGAMAESANRFPSYVDVGAERDQFGIASQVSMEDHGQGFPRAIEAVQFTTMQDHSGSDLQFFRI